LFAVAFERPFISSTTRSTRASISSATITASATCTPLPHWMQSKRLWKNYDPI
jgi:hypothetical protein